MSTGYAVVQKTSNNYGAISYSSSGIPFTYIDYPSYGSASRSPFSSGTYVNVNAGIGLYIEGSKGNYTSGTCYSSFGLTYADSDIDSITYYTISISGTTGGNVSWTTYPNYCAKSESTVYAISGYTGSISATPNDGYYFVRWSDGNTDASRTVTFSSDQSISAVFAKKPTLTVTAGDGGSITSDPSGVVSPNSTYSATAAADDGYRFVGWYSGGSCVSTDNPVSISVGTSDVTYEARFASKYHTVTVDLADASPSGSGTVKMIVDGTECASGTSVIEGSQVQIVCTANLDYNFYEWLVNGVAKYTASHSFIVGTGDDSTIACLAVITEKNSYGISVTKVEPTRGTVSLADSEKSWSETDNTISATGHSGVKYTVTAKVTSSLSDTGRELNKFVEFTKNESNLSYTADSDGYTYTATFTNGTNSSSESLDDVAIVATFAQKSLYHAELSIPYTSRGTATITPDPDSTSTNDKWLEGTITAVATPATGMYVRSFNVQDIDAKGNGFVVDYPEKDSSGNYNCSFTLNFNAKIIVNFDQIPCTVSVGVDSASYGKGTATVSSTAQGGDVSNMSYGDIAIYNATPYDGYMFGGWYTADGSTAPDSTITSGGVTNTYTYTDVEYRISLTGDLKLNAKFKAKVTIGLSSTESASGAVYLDDESTTSGTVSKWVTLGDTCSIKAVPSGSESSFGSWYKSTDTEFTDPLDIASEDTLTVTDTLYYVARFISGADALYCAVCNFDNDTEEGDASLGNLYMMTSGSSPVEVDETTLTDFCAATGLSEAPDGATKFYKCVGTERVTLVASPAMGRGFNKWMRLTVDNGSVGGETSLGTEATVSTVVNRHFIYRAYWGDPKPVLVSVHYCTGSSVVNGNINIDGVTVADATIEDKTETDTETSATYTQGDVVSISVDIKNGYLFDGWYYDEEHNEPLRDSTVDDVTYKYTDGEYRFTVSSPVTIFAKFKQDTNALYKWEGSSENKMMDWKSKVYVASRPFDPSVVRVDADGYTTEDGGSLSLTIGMFSSPNSSATSTRTLNITSQDMRRVPTARPERYAQVEVKNNDDVNAIFVGTSSQEIAV